ncbi:hypothetical protein ACEPAG_4909 [Sanghuangporus baumii]
MNHDTALNQATSSTSVAAAMTSLEPQGNLNPSRMYARPAFASRSLSQLPRFNECHRHSSSQGPVKEEMLALLRSGSQRTASSVKSSTSSSQSAVGPAITSAPPARPERSPARIGSPEPAYTTTMDASFTSTSSLSPRARRQLLRSARKVGYILGETPVLRTNVDSSDPRESVADPSELGVLPSSSSAPSASRKGTSSPYIQRRSRPKADTGLSMYDGLASAFLTPQQYTNLSVDQSPFVPTLSRMPPVLKVDCAVVVGTSKSSRLGSSDAVTRDADAQSFVSTTTTTTMASDLFSPSTSRRSPISPIEARFAIHEQGKELPREARRSKVAKLSRHLGEHVPSELVFPLEAKTDQEDSEPYVLISYEKASPVSPLADKSKTSSSTPESEIIRPPMRSASLRRRKRKSLQLDLDGSSSGSSSTPSTSASSSTEVNSIGSASSKYKPARTLSRSHSLRSRIRKHADTSPSAGRFSDSSSSENTTIHPASAPPAQTVHDSGKDKNTDQGPKVEVAGEKKQKELESRTSLSDAQRALNVRRAQKMLSVFGEAPPNTLLPVKSKCDSPSAIGRSVMGGTRYKRHSISSIITSASSFMDAQPATFDSPISPMTPRPRILNGEATSTPTCTLTSRNSLKVQTNLSPRRRASLSALPNTPPPFSQYCGPPSPLSNRQNMQNESSEQSTTTPKASRAQSDTIKHSPHSSSGSSASPPTPGSGSGSAQGAQDQDPGAVFRERRLRAAKLARFFGVGYGDLYPALVGVDEDIDVRLSKSSFDNIRFARVESFEKEKERVKERESKLVAKRMAAGTRVSVTVQREVDDPGSGRVVFSSSASESSSDLSLSESEENTTTESAELKPDAQNKPVIGASLTTSSIVSNTLKTTSTAKDVDGNAVGCYRGFSFSSGLAPSRNASMRRRQGGPDAMTSTGDSNRTSRNVGSGLTFGLGTGMFSLGRQSRRTASVKNSNLNLNSSLESGSATLGRKGSTPTRRAGGRALTFGERRSILSRASCGDFGANFGGNNIGSRTSFLHGHANTSSTDESQNAGGIGIAITTSDAEERERERLVPRVRVGEKIADVSEVMARLRELR